MKRYIIVITALFISTIAKANDDMMPSQNLIDHIKQTEGFRECAYKDYKANAIGYGSQRWEDGTAVELYTGKGKNRKKVCITEERAKELLLHFVYFKAGQIDGWAKANRVKLNQNEFDALVGFTYNLGFGAFRSSSIAKYIKLKNKKLAAEFFEDYNKGGGKVLKGLETRRAWEKKLFLTPVPKKKKEKK